MISWFVLNHVFFLGNHDKNLAFTVDWQNPAPVPGSGPGPFKGAAPQGGAAAIDGPGPGPDPGTGAGFFQSAVNPKFLPREL